MQMRLPKSRLVTVLDEGCHAFSGVPEEQGLVGPCTGQAGIWELI